MNTCEFSTKFNNQIFKNNLPVSMFFMCSSLPCYSSCSQKNGLLCISTMVMSMEMCVSVHVVQFKLCLKFLKKLQVAYNVLRFQFKKFKIMVPRFDHAIEHILGSLIFTIASIFMVKIFHIVHIHFTKNLHLGFFVSL